METLFAFLFFIFLILAIVGVFKPSIVKQSSRIKGFFYPLLASFVSAIIGSSLAPQLPLNVESNVTSVQTIQALKTEIEELKKKADEDKRLEELKKKANEDKRLEELKKKADEDKRLEELKKKADNAKKIANTPTNQKIKKFLEDRNDYRDIKIVSKNPLFISMWNISVENDLQENIEFDLNRGLFYGAFWSFYVDNNLESITVNFTLKGMKTQKEFINKKLTIKRIDLLEKLNEYEIVKSFKDATKVGEYGILNIRKSLNNKTYTNSNELKKIISFLSNETSDEIDEYLLRQLAKDAGADYDKMQSQFQKNMELLKSKHNP